MKRIVSTVVMFVATIALASSAFAQDASKKKQPADPSKPPATKPAEPAATPSMEMPPPPPEVAEAAKKMQGAWKCTGTAPMMGNKAVKGTMTFKLDPAKYFIVGTWKSPKTKDTPAMSSVHYRTYDASSKKWMETGIDITTGGTFRATSSGPQGSKTVWDGKHSMLGMNGQEVATRMTQEEVGPREVKLVAEMAPDGKKYMTAWEATCKR
jgi:hypothetical protein